MSELKDYDIMDIEAMDDERLEKLESGKIQATRVYIKSEADKVIEELESMSKHLCHLDIIMASETIKYLEERHKKEVGQLLMEIAELKKERNWLAKDRSQAYDDLEKRAQLNIKQEESNRHQKFKRCLAMAKWCENAILGWMGHKESYSLYQRLIKVMLFTKWHKRWLELAEQFKEWK